MADYSAAITLNPSHYRAYYNRAFAHDRLARYDLAARQGFLKTAMLPRATSFPWR